MLWMRAYFRTAILGILILAAIVTSVRFFKVAYYHLKAPHDICLETHNLASIKSIKAGANIYSRHFYGDLPFIITIYNPLFHFLVASLPESNSNPFFTGRLISLISTLLTALLLFLPGGTRRHPMTAFLFVILFLLLRLTVLHAAYLRSDTLAMFFSGVGIVLLERVQPKRSSLVLIAFICFLAFLSKQNFMAASITCCLFQLSRNRKDGTFFIMLLGAMYSGFAVFAQSFWGSGYWFSVFLALMRTPASLTQSLSLWKSMFADPSFALLTVITVLNISYAIVKHKSHFVKESPYPLFLFFSFLASSLSAAKLGSSENCFLEVVLAALLWNVYSSKALAPELLGNLAKFGTTFVVLILASIEVTVTKPNLYSFADGGTIAFREKAYEIAKKEIKELNPVNDHFVCLNSYAALYKLQSTGYLNDPLNYWLMWENNILDVSSFVRAIEQRKFSIILVVSPENPYQIPAMTGFSPGAVLDRINKALSEHYELRKRGVFIYLKPHKGSGNPKGR
jgi:hypothetical protein